MMFLSLVALGVGSGGFRECEESQAFGGIAQSRETPNTVEG